MKIEIPAVKQEKGSVVSTLRHQPPKENEKGDEKMLGLIILILGVVLLITIGWEVLYILGWCFLGIPLYFGLLIGSVLPDRWSQKWGVHVALSVIGGVILGVLTRVLLTLLECEVPSTAGLIGLVVFYSLGLFVGFALVRSVREN